MHLTSREEKALEGEYGEPLEMAYRVLLALGRLTNAKHLIPIKWAHVSGVSYLTIGEYGLDFLERIARKDAKFRTFTTVNPCGIDIENWKVLGISSDYAERQLKIIRAYEKLGIASSFTCVPFQSYPVPKRGTHVSWAESSAAIFANSILGIRTNRESAVSALASALTGKTVYSDLHIDSKRKPTCAVRITKRSGVHGSLDFGILGYFSGKKASGVVEFQGVRQPAIQESKSLCAALGTVGSIGMFTLGQSKRLETVEFGDKEFEDTLSELSDNSVGDLVVFGCPQMTIEELYELSKLLKGKNFKKKCIVFCSSKIYEVAKVRGYTEPIEAAGATFVRDACADFTPLISSLKASSVETDSVKGAHYMKRVHGVKTTLHDTGTLIKENAR
ncbi:MAG: aconitase X catalytic domain-containing protein [Nitrososphaerales archaeon]